MAQNYPREIHSANMSLKTATHPLVIDVETQHSLQEVGYDARKLKISVAGVYDYARDKYTAFFENELPELFRLMEHSSHLVGFNINKFDLAVLSPYYVGNIFQFRTLDILDEVQNYLGYRIPLDELARSTLNVKKSGHGFLAIEYFRKNELEKLKNYCLDDVKITKNIYEYGKKHKRLYLRTSKGEEEIPVVFEKENLAKINVPLSLQFDIL